MYKLLHTPCKGPDASTTSFFLSSRIFNNDQHPVLPPVSFLLIKVIYFNFTYTNDQHTVLPLLLLLLIKVIHLEFDGMY